MMSKFLQEVLTLNARDRRDRAALSLAEAADRLNRARDCKSPLLDLYEEQFDSAFAEFDSACAELEEVHVAFKLGLMPALPAIPAEKGAA